MAKQFKPFDEAFFLGLDRESRRLDYDVVVFMTAGYFIDKSDYDIQEKNILQYAPLETLDGIIAIPSSYVKGEFRDMAYEMIRERITCPLVVVREESDEFNCVYTDNTTAMRNMIRHLIEDHGLTKICYQVGDFDSKEAAIRLEAYRREMEAHGLPVSDEMICAGNMWTNCGQVAYDAFFSDPDNIPEAVACANDYMAMGLIRVLRENGYRVPEDVIVTGFDNITNWCTDVPGLTTIKPDFDGMVTEAMSLLDQLIRSEDSDKKIRGRKTNDQLKRIKDKEPVRIGLPGEIVLSESCGCGKREERFFENLANIAMSKLEDENDQDASMNNLGIDLGTIENLQQLHKVLTSKRTVSPIVRDHYICLFGTADHLMEEEGQKACLVHAIRDHQDGGTPMIDFDRSKLLPMMAERSDEAQVFYLKLLHQNRHNFGYCMIHYDPGKMPSRCFVQSNVLLSIALENYYRQREIFRLYEERRLFSITDVLTGLLNRRGMEEKIEPMWLSLTERQIAFICIDLDKLKTINDTYGHAAGDAAIRLVGRAIHETLPEEALGGRTGGDEFIVFLPDAGQGAADRFVAAFEKRLAMLNEEAAKPFQVTASAGFAVLKPKGNTTIEECIQASDRALYDAKENRK